MFPHPLPFVARYSGGRNVELRTKLLTGVHIDDDGCWIWGRSLVAEGYGVLGQRMEGRNKTYYAHRASYMTFIGPIPEGFTIDHLCRKRACINPAHLEAVTHQENGRRNSNAWRNRVIQLSLPMHEHEPQQRLDIPL